MSTPPPTKNFKSISAVTVENLSKKNIFTFKPEDYKDEFSRQGYILIKSGVNPKFVTVANEQAAKQQAEKKDLNSWRFKGKKRQYLYEFEEWNFLDGLKTLAKTAGLSEKGLTLCERHIKVYEPDAQPYVPAHKDRVAAQLTVGIPLSIPKESHIVLWPDSHLAINTFNTTADWRSNLDEKDLPENILENVEPVRVYAEPGDVVLFLGSSIHHERENPADASILYLKMNDMRLDPLGEDPSTSIQLEKSQSFIKQISDTALLNSTVDVSPRLIKISRHYTRLYWKEVIQAYVADEKEFCLSEIELNVFKAIDGEKTVEEILKIMGVPAPEMIGYIPIFKRLVTLKGLDIILTST